MLAREVLLPSMLVVIAAGGLVVQVASCASYMAAGCVHVAVLPACGQLKSHTTPARERVVHQKTGDAGYRSPYLLHTRIAVHTDYVIVRSLPCEAEMCNNMTGVPPFPKSLHSDDDHHLS